MWYGNTKNLLESIVRGLKNEPPQNDAEWQAQEDLVQGCLAEMVEMSEPTVNPSMGPRLRYVHRPVADELWAQLAKANRAECASLVASGSLLDDSLKPGSSVHCAPASGPTWINLLTSSSVEE